MIVNIIIVLVILVIFYIINRSLIKVSECAQQVVEFKHNMEDQTGFMMDDFVPFIDTMQDTMAYE